MKLLTFTKYAGAAFSAILATVFAYGYSIDHTQTALFAFISFLVTMSVCLHAAVSSTVIKQTFAICIALFGVFVGTLGIAIGGGLYPIIGVGYIVTSMIWAKVIFQ